MQDYLFYVSLSDFDLIKSNLSFPLYLLFFFAIYLGDCYILLTSVTLNPENPLGEAIVLIIEVWPD